MKNLFYKITLIIAGSLLALTAQARQVRGVVTDTEGNPLAGISVMVKGTTQGVSTDADGLWQMDVADADGKTLEFACLGMTTKEVLIGNSSVINVVMEEDMNFLDETVVIGYASVKRRDLMGSVASVDNKSLMQAPVTSVTEALTGRMPGVQVTTTEGDPDAEVKIRVRGGGSITQDSSPLYIVDGFPVESISDIPASDIQSIDILKDAFSTAIYGSRGANGVILVTTKSAASGKISVSYNAYYGLKKMANADAIKTQGVYDFVRNQYELSMLRGRYEEDYLPVYGSFQDMDLYEDVVGNDWIQQVFGRVGSTFNHNISVSGSSDKAKWSLSYARLDDKAVMIGSDYLRDNLSFKAQFKPIKQITVDVNTRYSYTKVMGAGANSINDSGSTSGSSARLKHAVQYTPIPLSSTSSDSDLEEDYGDNAPPLQSVADNDNRRIRKEWTANAAVTWHIIDNLNLKVEGGISDYSQEDNRFYGLTTYYVGNNASYPGPANMYKNSLRKKIRSTNTLSYNFENLIEDDRHKLDLLFGQEYILTKSNLVSMTVEGFPEFFTSENAWNFMSSGKAVASNNFFNPDDQLLSFFGRANYDFDSRYSLSGTLRADGSSKFTVGNQWGVFPSVAASWNISNESWFSSAARTVDQLKLRYSFGTAGNNNIPSGVTSMLFAAYNTTWISQDNIYWSTVTSGGKTTMPNPDLTWETTLSHNIGLDFAMWNSRVSGSLELYHNTTRNMLIAFPISGTGYNIQYQNLGAVENKGLEFSLNMVLVEKKNFGLSVGGNISLNKNVVKSLGGLKEITADTGWASTEIGVDYIVREGEPLGTMYGYVSDGFYTVDDFTYDGTSWVLNPGVPDASIVHGESFLRPGALKIKDLTPDGKITADDKTVIGHAQPLGVGGFNVIANLYGFDFSANFNYVFGNDIYNANKIEFTSSRKYSNRNLMQTSEQRWTNIDWDESSPTYGELITDPDKLAQVNAGATLWNSGIQTAAFTDWAVEDGSFLRLANATLGYTIPQSLTQRIGMSRLRVYVTGTNLFCLTNYSGYDPEVDCRRATPLTPGVDYSAYPKSIGFVAGINITF